LQVAFAQQLVQGQQVEVEQLKELANHELISKVWLLNEQPATDLCVALQC
jgi:hypothetical protein